MSDRETAPASAARRLAYRLSYVVLLASGRAAARLAADFRILGSLDKRFAFVSVVLQVPVLACWALIRPISLAAFAAYSALAPAR
jgi:hypothetical protein